MSLQQQLQALEERAHNIEADIRNSMSIGELAGTGKGDASIKQDDVDDYAEWLNSFHVCTHIMNESTTVSPLRITPSHLQPPSSS